MVPRVKMLIASKKGRNKEGVIVQVNDYWGWFKVVWKGGKTGFYDIDKCDTYFEEITPVMRADRRLRKENAGITDSWRNYD